MAEKKPLNRGAKILKEKLDKERIKNANKRARKDAKADSGTMKERVRKAAKKAPEKRGLPAKIENSRGNVNKANPPKEIRLKGEGGTGRSIKDTRFKPIPLGDRPKALPSPPKPNTRMFNPGAAAGRLLGPAGFLVGMTTPAGEGSDRPSGPLMRGNAVARYEDQRVNRAGKGDLPKARVAAPPKPKAKPVREASPEKKKLASEFRAKMQGQKRTFAKPKEKTYPFKGNWVGAAPTEMQKRGGQRRKQGNLLSFLKNR